MTDIILNIPTIGKEKEEAVLTVNTLDINNIIYSFEEGGSFEDEPVEEYTASLNDLGEISYGIKSKEETVDSVIETKPEDFFNKENISKEEDFNKELPEEETSYKIIIENNKKEDFEAKENNVIETISEPKEASFVSDSETFVKNQEDLTVKTVDEITNDALVAKDIVTKNTAKAVDDIIKAKYPENEPDNEENAAAKEKEKQELDQKQEKAKVEFKNDLFYNSTFSVNIKNNLTAYDMTLKSADELWKNDFIKDYYDSKYGVESSRKEFDIKYNETLEIYKELHSQKREDIALMDNANSITITGNRMIDISAGYGQSPEKAKTIASIYSRLDDEKQFVDSRETFLGEQGSFFGEMSISRFSTPAEAFMNKYKDENGEIQMLKAGDTERLADEDKLFIVSTGSDGIHSRDLTSRGMGYMSIMDRTQRAGADYMIVPAYETSDEHFWYSWYDHVQDAQYNGVGDWMSVFPASIMNLGLQLANSAVSMAQVVSFANPWHEEESDTLRAWSNSIKKYTPGRTYEATNNMWGLESIFTTTIDAAAQLLFAVGMGKTLKKFPKTANFSVRALLTMYGAGTAYDEALDRNMSEREASSYFVSVFAGLWYVNSMSKWITDSSEGKAIYSKMKEFTLNKFDDSIAKTANETGAGKFQALTKFWSGAGKTWDKVLKNGAVEGFVEEGLEESAEEIAQEVSRQIQNAYRAITGKKLDEKNGFQTMTSDGYWGNLVNNTVFSGVIGGISGGAAGGFKMALNRKVADIKNLDSNVDVLMFTDESGKRVGEQYFLNNLKMMYDKGQLGVKDLDIRDMKTIVNEDSEWTQANFNMNMILTDFALTKKTLGESADLGLRLGNDVDINIAKVAKDAMKGAMGIYGQYDIDFDDFKDIQKTNLDDFNKKKAKESKEWKDITSEDYTKLTELNELLEGIKDGSRFQYEFFKTMVSNDNIFGSSENRMDVLKDPKFDNLSYSFFKKMMSLSDIENENINSQLLKIAESEDIEIGESLDDLKKAISEFKKMNIITVKKKNEIITQLTNDIQSDELFTSLEEKAESEIKEWLDTKKEVLLTEIEHELKVQDDLFNNNEDVKYKKVAEKRIKELNLTKTKLEDISSYSGVLMKIFEYNKTSDLNKGFIRSTIYNYKSLDDNLVLSIISTLVNTKSNNFETISEVLNKNIKPYTEGRTLTSFFDELSTRIDTKGIDKLEAKYLSIYEDLQTLKTVNKDDLEKSKIDNISFLDKVLNLDMETGAVISTDKTVSEGMLSYIDLLRGFIKQYGEKGTDSYKKILGLSLNEVGPIHFSLQIQNRFLILMHKNIRSLNSVNRYIEGIKNGDISIVNNKPKNNAFNKFLDRSKLRRPFNITKKIFKPFTLSGIDVIPNVKINHEEVETRTSYNKILNEKIFSLNKELAVEKDSKKAFKIKEKVNSLEQMQEKDKLLHDNLVDFDRIMYLNERKTKGVLTSDEEKELNGYEERVRQLESPSEALFNAFISKNVAEIEKLNKETSILEEEINKESVVLKENQDKLNKTRYSKSLKITPEEMFFLNDLAKTVEAQLKNLKEKKTELQIKQSLLVKLTEETKLTAEEEKNRLEQEEKGFWKKDLNISEDSDEETSRKLKREDSPMMKYIYNSLKEQFFNGKKDAPDLENFLSFMETVYSNKDLTIADRTIITNTFYKILEEQAKDYSNMGKGVNYDEELKKSAKQNLKNIISTFKDINFKCLNN